MLLNLIIFIIFLVLILYIINNRKEYFNVNQINNKNECEGLQMNDCLKTDKCGYVTTNKFVNMCVPGDKNGPYGNIEKYLNKSEYFKWYYNDDYTRANIANDNNYRNMNRQIFD